MNMFNKVQAKQDKELDKAMKANGERLSGHSRAILDFMSTLDITVADAKILIQGIITGIDKVLEHKTMPVLQEHKGKKFKEFYEESEANAPKEEPEV